MHLPIERAEQLLCAAIADRRLITFTLDGFRRDTLIATVSPRPVSRPLGVEPRSGTPSGRKGPKSLRQSGSRTRTM